MLLFCIPMQLIHFDCVNGFLNSIKEIIWQTEATYRCPLRGVEWVHGLFLFPLVLKGNCSCHMQNWGFFLCSLDNLLQKNVIFLFLGNQISKWRSFEKRAIFDLLFTFSSHQGEVTKIPSAHISNTYIHIFCSPYRVFLPYQF